MWSCAVLGKNDEDHSDSGVVEFPPLMYRLCDQNYRNTCILQWTSIKKMSLHYIMPFQCFGPHFGVELTLGESWGCVWCFNSKEKQEHWYCIILQNLGLHSIIRFF